MSVGQEEILWKNQKDGSLKPTFPEVNESGGEECKEKFMLVLG